MLARLRSLLRRENGDRGESPARQKEAGLPSEFKPPRKKWPWGRRRASGEPSSPANLLSKKQVRKEMERLTAQLQVITQERNDLRDRVILITEGSLDKRPYNRPNPFVEELKKEHKLAMMALQDMETEKMETSKQLRELKQETGFFRNLRSRLLMEQNQLKKRVEALRQENKKVQEECALLKQMCKDQEEEQSDRQTQQEEVLEGLEELLQCLRKKKERIIRLRDSGSKLKNELGEIQMMSETLQQEIKLKSAQLAAKKQQQAAGSEATC